MNKNKNAIKTNSERFGEKLKLFRKAKGFTQEQLAEKIDIDTKYLARIEKDMHNPTFNVMKKLSQVLDFDMSQIDELNTRDIPTPNKNYLKALQILNSAKSDEDVKLYLEALQHTQKCLKKNCKQKS